MDNYKEAIEYIARQIIGMNDLTKAETNIARKLEEMHIVYRCEEDSVMVYKMKE